MLTSQSTTHNDALHGLSHIEPGTGERRVERHDAMLKEPGDQVVREMTSQIIQHEQDAQRRQRTAWWMAQPGLPLGIAWAFLLGRQRLGWLLLLEIRQNGGELLF